MQVYFLWPLICGKSHASTHIWLNSMVTNFILIFEVLNSEFWTQSKMSTYHLWKPIWSWFWANCQYQILTLWLKSWKVGWKTWFKSSWTTLEFGSITKVSNYFFHCISQWLNTKCEKYHFFVLIFVLVAIWKKKRLPGLFSFRIATSKITKKKNLSIWYFAFSFYSWLSKYKLIAKPDSRIFIFHCV